LRAHNITIIEQRFDYTFRHFPLITAPMPLFAPSAALDTLPPACASYAPMISVAVFACRYDAFFPRARLMPPCFRARCFMLPPHARTHAIRYA